MRQILNKAAVAAGLLLLATPATGGERRPPGGQHVERTVYLMGTELRMTVEAADRPSALAASERAVRAVEATESRLSTWRTDTELARLNRAPAGRRVALSRPLAEDLAEARWCWEATHGAFDPTVGALVDAWGLRVGGRRPSASEVRAALGATGMGGFVIEDGSAIRRRADLRIEEGGFGKGAGLGAALEVLASAPGIIGAELDFGGQLAVLGEDTAWRATVAHPRDRDRPVAAVSLEGGSIATSGNSERAVEVDGARRGHLLDPRTGYPAEDFGSLTVWTDDPLRADCLSTGLYVMGPDAALSWAAERPGVEVLVLDEADGRLRARVTPGLAERVTIHGYRSIDLSTHGETQNATSRP